MLKAIIPAAGLGTRFLPATKAVPKELLPLGNKPAIHRVVEEAVQAGIQDIVIVLHPEKEAIRKYFEENAYEEALRKKNKEHLLDELDQLRKKIRLKFVYQEERNGLGDAVLCAKRLVQGDVAILLGDAVLYGAPGCMQQLKEQYEQYDRSVINIEHVTPADKVMRGMVDGLPIKEKIIRITQVVEKPKVFHTDIAVSARYILKKRIFDLLEITPKGANNELQLTDAVAALLKEEEVYGCFSGGRRFDIGQPDWYLEAMKTFVEVKQ